MLPPSPATSSDAVSRRPLVGKDRVVDRVVHEARHDLADDALAALRRGGASRAGRDCARAQFRRIQHVADFGDLHALVAVVQEHAREAGQREARREHAADGALRELADVADVAGGRGSTPPVMLRSNRNGSVKPTVVVLRARPGLQRHRQALAAPQKVRRLERQLAEEALELRDAGAEAELVAVLLLELQPDVDLVRLRPASCR